MGNNHNPFIFGRAVQGNEFFHRENELYSVFNRLRTGQSVAIIGEPHVGKTSFLLKLFDKETQSKYLDDDDKKLILTYLDLHPINPDYTTIQFWEEILSPLEKVNLERVKYLFKQVSQNGYRRKDLELLFSELAARNRMLVLLLDEFERLFSHPNFKDPSFFALLRSLSSTNRGLAIVIASRLPLAKLNRLGREILDSGSPFFNTMIDIKLLPFSDDEINSLLSTAKPTFTDEENLYIQHIAGRNPYLLQAMASSMYDSKDSNMNNKEIATEKFYNQINSYFDDLWEHLEDQTKTVAILLCLKDLDGRLLGSGFNYAEIEKNDYFDIELRRLKECGISEMVGESKKGWIIDWKYLLVWRGQKWALGCTAFGLWVRDIIIARTRSIPSHDSWLKNKRYVGILTTSQWEFLMESFRKVPQSFLVGVGKFVISTVNDIFSNSGG